MTMWQKCATKQKHRSTASPPSFLTSSVTNKRGFSPKARGKTICTNVGEVRESNNNASARFNTKKNIMEHTAT